MVESERQCASDNARQPRTNRKGGLGQGPEASHAAAEPAFEPPRPRLDASGRRVEVARLSVPPPPPAFPRSNEAPSIRASALRPAGASLAGKQPRPSTLLRLRLLERDGPLPPPSPPPRLPPSSPLPLFPASPPRCLLVRRPPSLRRPPLLARRHAVRRGREGGVEVGGKEERAGEGDVDGAALQGGAGWQ